MGKNFRHILRSAKNRLLWKIRHRLILANIFIGAIPVLVVIAIFWYAGLLFYYQFSYYLVTNQIAIHSAQIHAFSISLKDRLQEAASDSGFSTLYLKDLLDSDTRFLLSSYPTAVLVLNFKDPDTGRMITYINHGESTGAIERYSIPDWVQEIDFRGLVDEDVQPNIYGRRLFLRSFISSDFMSDLEFSLEVSVPFDQSFLNRLKSALGQDVLLAKRVNIPKLNIMFQNVDVQSENIVDSTFNTESGSSRSGWMLPLFPVSWSNDLELKRYDLGVLLVEPSAAKLLANIYKSENPIGKSILAVLQVIVVVFLIVEGVSVWIGIKLTKSITAAVQSLDRGTEFVKRGDFGHKIHVRSADQLGALATSFNQMTDYVQQLIQARVLKERMERELEIAKEVQQLLFPRHAPRMASLDVSGICLPARVVSGDYFDYLSLADSRLGLAVGDICGKGISAALLMANLQAALRSTVVHSKKNGGDRYEAAVALVVQRMNRQIFEYTADNKFATLFYGVYNDADCTLTYCNAGHNPPLYFEGDTVRTMKVGGTVIGIFPDARYEQETIQLNTAGVFVAYTDGIIECVNEREGEFGEERLIRLVRQYAAMDAETIKNRIIDAVTAWSSIESREDDMTLIVAKVRSSD